MKRFKSKDAWLLSTLLGVMLSTNTHGQDSLPDSIKDKLEANASSLHHLTVKYQVVRSSELPLEEILQRIGSPKYLAFFKHNSIEFILQDGKWLRRTKIWDYDEKKKNFWENPNLSTYDGELLYGTNLRKWGSVVNITDKKHHEKMTPLYRSFGYDYFLYDAGFAVSDESVSTWLPLESSILYMLKKGATLASSSGNATATEGDFEVVLNDVSGRHRFVLDLAKNCAVKEHGETTLTGELKYLTVNSKFVQLPGTLVWLPKLCRMACYTWTTTKEIWQKPIAFEEVVVDEIDNSKVYQESEFVIDWKKPGNKVGDSRIDGAENRPSGIVSYQVPTNLDHLDQVVEEASRKAGAGRGYWRIVLIAGNVTLIAALIYALIRRRKAASA